jgi:thiosulfate/3-mercaptopyruvate sulfurtransferase
MIDRSILIVAEQALQHLQEPDWIAVDCRFDLADPGAGRAMYEREHIPSAVYLDLDRDLAGPITATSGRHPLPDAETIARRLGELGIGNGVKVVVYDANAGAIAARAWWILRWLGHEKVYLLDGGFERWLGLGYAVEHGPVRRSPVPFAAQPRADLVVTTAELEADIDRPSGRRLLDARDRVRFRGDEEPIDPVAGHVPGARSVPYAAFVRADGTWRPLDERRELLLAALDGDPERPWSVMCGSGVTACHLALSGLEAGLTEPRLYVGSWSEWIRDGRRPVALGDDRNQDPDTADLA